MHRARRAPTPPSPTCCCPTASGRWSSRRPCWFWKTTTSLNKLWAAPSRWASPTQRSARRAPLSWRCRGSSSTTTSNWWQAVRLRLSREDKRNTHAYEVRAKGVRKEETPTRITTTLYELIAALHNVVDPDADALVVATVMHLLHAGQLTFVGKTRTYARQSRHEMRAG